MYTNKGYILNKVMFEHYHSIFPLQEDYCFITIVLKDYKYNFEQQLNEMERLMHSFPFYFIACREFSMTKAGGWHFHFITHKQNLPYIGEQCEYDMQPPKRGDCFEKALSYMCKEDVKECTADDYSRSSKMYYQKNNANTAFYKVIHRDNKIKLISVPKQIELILPTVTLAPQQIEIISPIATTEQSITTLKNGLGSFNWGSYFRPFQRFFWQLFIGIKKTFFKAKYGYQRENNSYSGWSNNSP
jgi:hypothetical protein